MAETGEQDAIPAEQIGLNTLRPAPGSRKARKRVGRGEGSGTGKTAGRGQKGAGSRSGSKTRHNFEGGQMPIHMRMRKLRGPHMKKSMPFEPFRTHTQAVNLKDLERRFEEGTEVTLDALRAHGLANRKGVPVKVLAGGRLTKKLTVHAHAFSASAREAIEAAGGTAEVVERWRIRAADLAACLDGLLERSDRTLRRSREAFRTITEAARDAMVIVDEAGEVVLVNSQAERLFGWKRQELLGRSLETLLPERFRAGHALHRGAFLAEPIARPMGSGLELYALHREGHEVPVEISLAPLVTEDGCFVSASIRDVTARKRLDESLVETQKLESLGVLAGGIAHDFNNLLGVVVGNAGLAMADAPPGSLVRKALEEITRAAERGSDLTRQIVAYSGKGRYIVGPVRLDRVAGEVAALPGQPFGRGAAERLLGGAIRVQSEPDRGTSVKLLFRACGAPSPTTTATRTGAARASVLVADDEELVRAMAARMLTRLGFTAVPVRDGADALQVLRERHGEFALAVLDVVMPGLTGEEVLAALKRHGDETPVVVVSAFGSPELRERLVSLGAAAFLPKPFDLEELRAAVRVATKARAAG